MAIRTSKSGVAVLVVCQAVSLMGCAGQVIDADPEKSETNGDSSSGSGDRPDEPYDPNPYPEPAPDPYGTGGTSVVVVEPSTGGSGGGAVYEGPLTDDPDAFHLMARNVPAVATVSEFNPGVYGYYLQLNSGNATIEAALGGKLVETGATGSIDLDVHSCVPATTGADECDLSVTQFGGGPSGTNADLRLIGYSVRSDFEGVVVRHEDGWVANVSPMELIFDTNTWSPEGESEYHGLSVSEITFSCSPESCNVDLYAY